MLNRVAGNSGAGGYGDSNRENSGGQGVSIGGQTCYIDFQAQDMPQPPSQAYIAQLIQDLKAAGVTTINLSFDQINGGIPQQYQSAYQALIAAAHAAQMKAVMSFGGEMASVDNWTPNSSSLSQIEQLVNTYHLDGMDFDVEISTLPPNLPDFFSQLHEFAHSGGRDVNMSLTVMGYPGNSVGTYVPPWNISDGPLAGLFFNGTMGSPDVTFNQMFDGLNLMMYGSSQDLISGGKPSSDLQQWMNIIQHLNIPLSSTHIGFMDGIAYGNAPAGLTAQAGVDAANAYIQALQGLSPSLTPNQLGDPFWWPQEGQYADRYSNQGVMPSGSSGSFGNAMMQAFYSTLQGSNNSQSSYGARSSYGSERSQSSSPESSGIGKTKRKHKGARKNVETSSSKVFSNSSLPKGAKVEGSTCYVDLSTIYGNGFDVGTWTQNVMNELKQSHSGIDHLNLLVPLYELTPQGLDSQYLSFIQAAHAAGASLNPPLHISISLGGAATSSWSFGSDQNGAACAKALLNSLTVGGKLMADNVDIDYEDMTTYSGGNGPPGFASFLTNLRNGPSGLEAAGVGMSFTVLAYPSNTYGCPTDPPPPPGAGTPGSQGPLYNIFKNFSSYFDKVNLMLYNGDQYLNNPSTGGDYCLKAWVGIFNTNHIPLSDLSVGLSQTANYGGGSDPVANGTAAANMYKQVLQDIGITPSQLASPFWWPGDNPFGTQSGGNWSGAMEGAFNQAMQ